MALEMRVTVKNLQKIKISSVELARCIEFLISQEPIKAGMRLKSCVDLGMVLGISHMSVQRAVQILVDKGLLESRNGSGTYVRKIPYAVEEVPPRFAALLDANDLLAPKANKTSAPGHRAPNTAPLRIALWCDVVLLNKASRLMIKGAEDYLRKRGHILDIKNVVTMNAQRTAHLNGDEDGIISLYMPDHYIKRFFADVTVPIVFLHAEYQVPISLASRLLYLDVGETMERAIRLLADSGARSVAVLTADRDENIPLIEDRCRFLSERLKIGTRVHRVSADMDTRSLEKVVAELARPETRPDAIYVADDIMFKYLAPVLRKYDLCPGENVALITLSNQGIGLPDECNWSRLEFNPERLGAMAAETVLNKTNCASYEILSFAHLAAWKPGDTHQLKTSIEGKRRP